MVLIRKTILSIVIVLLVVSILSPFWTGTASAQSPGGYTVYLPLVSKNYQEWLDILNQYRREAGLNPVTGNDYLSYTLSLHTKYMLLNPDQKDWHTEIEGEPGYTPEGKLAASQSNMLWTNNLQYTQKQAIDLWMATSRHRYHMLHPDMVESGFSLSCDSKNCFAGANVFAGLQQKSEVRIVYYPGADQINVPSTRFPISVGFYTTGDIGSISIVKAVLYDNKNNPVSGATTIINDYVKEVLFTPNADLLPNHKYRMELSVKAGSTTYPKTWYFTTEAN